MIIEICLVIVSCILVIEKMFKKKKTYVILVIILLVIGGVIYAKNKKPKVEYTTADVQKGTLAQTVSVTGTLVSPHQVDLSFKLPGRVQKMYADIGDTVTKGQKIATIDNGTLISQLREAQANVTTQKQTLAKMKREANKVEALNAQRAEVRSAEAAVSEIYDQLREITIYAPMDGIVIKKGVDEGEAVTANSAAGSIPVVTIAENITDLEIESNVPESDIVKIALDQIGNVTLDALPAADVLTAKVSEIEPAATVIQDVVYYKVKLQFPSSDSRLKNGMSADVDIHTAQKNNVVYIPERAIKDDGGKKYVEVLTDAKNNTTEKVYVTTGMRGDDGMIEITNGLKGGEKVITLTKTQ